MGSFCENITNSNGCKDEREEEGALALAMELACASVLPMVLKSAIELDLLELIKECGGAGASASELTAQLPAKNPQAAAEMIGRILRLLAAHSILTCPTAE